MPHPNDSASRKSRVFRGWQISLVLLLVSIAILGLMMAVGADFDFRQLQALFDRLDISLVASLLLLSTVNFTLRTLRWLWFSHNLGLDVPWRKSAIYYLAGFSMGVTPGRMGEIIRLWILHRAHGINYHRALPLLIGDRVNDLLVIIVLALFAGMIVDSAPLVIVIASLAFVVLANILLRYPRYLLAIINVLFELTQRWRKLFAAARRTLKTGRVVFSATNATIASTLSIAAWFAECFAFYLLLSALDTNISLATATFIYAFATLVGALSFLPGGLGGFEATAVILLNTNGIDIGTAAFAISVIRLTTLWFSVAVGSFMLTGVLFNKNSTIYKKLAI